MPPSDKNVRRPWFIWKKPVNLRQSYWDAMTSFVAYPWKNPKRSTFHQLTKTTVLPKPSDLKTALSAGLFQTNFPLSTLESFPALLRLARMLTKLTPPHMMMYMNDTEESYARHRQLNIRNAVKASRVPKRSMICCRSGKAHTCKLMPRVPVCGQDYCRVCCLMVQKKRTFCRSV